MRRKGKNDQKGTKASTEYVRNTQKKSEGLAENVYLPHQVIPKNDWLTPSLSAVLLPQAERFRVGLECHPFCSSV
jgi:hypothetical protein